MGYHEELSSVMAEGPVISEVEPHWKGDMAGMARSKVKGGEPRTQSNGGMAELLCCKMMRGEVHCTEKQNNGMEDIEKQLRSEGLRTGFVVGLSHDMKGMLL